MCEASDASHIPTSLGVWAVHFRGTRVFRQLTPNSQVPVGRHLGGIPLTLLSLPGVSSTNGSAGPSANEDYKKFVDAGCYERRDFWKRPFVRDGRAISWEDAIALFQDSTGRPGPAAWEAGSY